MSNETWAAEVLDAVEGTQWFVARAWLDFCVETRGQQYRVSLVHSSGRELKITLSHSQFTTASARTTELQRQLALADPLTPASLSCRIVRTWFREHDNGWRTIVNERRDGSFEAGAESPIVTGSMRSDFTGHPTFDAAAASGESDVRRAGHRCSSVCGDWQMVIGPP